MSATDGDVPRLPGLPGRYRPLSRLGQGGFAEVFLVEDDAASPRRKALKVLHAGLPEAALGALREEFRILASLEHPTLARVYDFGTLGDGRAFYTAEVVAGRPLGEGLGRDAAGTRAVVLAVAAICRALAYLHARGTLHGDVKPANILCGEAPGTARLLDFGIAGPLRGQARIVLGTPGYMAPERLRGQRCDGRSDLYAVGATLYRVLGGQPVVRAATPEEALMALGGAVMPLGRLRPDLPRALTTLVDDLLEPAAERRPRHPADVIRRLGEAIGEALPLETPGTTRLWSRASLVVGRDVELARVDAWLDRAVREPGSAALLAVTGGPGAGKSRFVHELAWRAGTRGLRVARARAVAGEAPDASLRALGPQLEEGLFGETGEGLPGGGAPLLVVLDDAEHAGPPTWQALVGAVRAARAGGRSVLVALAYDALALSAAARGHLALCDSSRIVSLPLAPLLGADVGSLLDSLFGPGVVPAAWREGIVRRSAGSPLVAEELAAELVARGLLRSGPAGWQAVGDGAALGAGSERLEELWRRRCQDLPDEGRRVQEVLGAFGGRASAEAVAALVGSGVAAALGLGALTERALLADVDTPTLAHGALGRLALDGMSEAARRDLHERAAAWWAGQGGGAGELARLYRAAGRPERAFAPAVEAGRLALAAMDGAAAVRWLELGCRAGEDAGLPAAVRVGALQALSQAHKIANRPAEALDVLAEAFALAPAADHRTRVALAMAALRPAAAVKGPAAVELWLDRAARAARPDDPLDQGRLAFAHGIAAWAGGRLRAQRDALRAARSALAGAPDDPAARALDGICLIELAAVETAFDPAAAAALASEAAAQAAAGGDRFAQASAAVNLAHHQLESGAVGVSQLEALVADAERQGAIYLVPTALCNLAEAHHRRGEWAAAQALVDRALAVASGSSQLLSMVQGALGGLRWREGDLGAAGRETARVLAVRWVEPHALMPVLAAAAAAAAAAPDGEPAVREALAARARAAAEAAESPLFAAWARAVVAYATLPVDPAAAGASLGQAATEIEICGSRVDAAALLRDAARALGRAGRRLEAHACLDRARQHLRADGNAAGLDRLDALDRALELPTHPEPAPPEGGNLVLDLARSASPGELGQRLRRLVPGAEADNPALFAALGAAAAAPGGGGAAGGDDGGGPGSLPGSLPDVGAAGPVRLDAVSRLVELTVGSVALRRAFPDVVGHSPALLRALSLLERLADQPVPVLLYGETGTGKEVFARALHVAGRRAGAPFVPINCAALPATLIEAELFGYRKGAFTGAQRDHGGLFLAAHGGTLFLDEIGELPLALQPKLLRALEEKRVRPLGGDREIPVEVRLCAATSRSLTDEVAAGRFRSDLYFRLSGVEITLPPLRERLADIPALAQHLLERHGFGHMVLSPSVLQALLDHRWPGNVRELDNEVLRAAVLAGPGPIRLRHLSAKLQKGVAGGGAGSGGAASRRGPLAERIAAFERDAVKEALAAAGGNRKKAALSLGITPQGLGKMMSRLGVRG